MNDLKCLCFCKPKLMHPHFKHLTHEIVCDSLYGADNVKNGAVRNVRHCSKKEKEKSMTRCEQ